MLSVFLSSADYCYVVGLMDRISDDGMLLFDNLLNNFTT